MADLDTALDEALTRYTPGWTPPETSAFMREQQRRREQPDAELVDIEADEPGQPVVLDEEDDFGSSR